MKYNYLELKSDLSKLGYEFKTTSDTEVIVYLLDKYGIGLLKSCQEFTFTWDETKKIIFSMI